MSAEVLTVESRRWRDFTERLFDKLGGKLPGRCDGDDVATGGTNTFRYSKAAMAEMGDVDVEGSLAYFEQHGGYCDCEILLNVDRR
jgi:hypothetical protein